MYLATVKMEPTERYLELAAFGQAAISVEAAKSVEATMSLNFQKDCFSHMSMVINSENNGSQQSHPTSYPPSTPHTFLSSTCSTLELPNETYLGKEF